MKTKLRSKVAFHAQLAKTVVLASIFGLTFLRTELSQVSPQAIILDQSSAGMSWIASDRLRRDDMA